MSTWKIKLSLFLNYFVFAILLNSVGTVILQVINQYHVTEASASVLEACKDLSIAIFSFGIASYLPRLGYKKAMLIALSIVTVACIIMPLVGGFTMTKILFVCVGISFALIKVSVYSTVSLVTKDSKEHASFMSTLEGIFQTGVLISYWIFGFFIYNKSFTWLDTYWVLALMSVLAFILLLTTSLDESSVKVEEATVIEDFLNMLRLIRLPLVLTFICTAFSYVFTEQSIQSWLPTFNNKILHLPDAMSVQVTSIFAGAIALGRIAGGYIMKKVTWIYVLATSLICSIILVIIVLPLSVGIQPGSVSGWSTAPTVAFIFPLIGFFLAPIYPTLCSTVLSRLPKKNQSAMSGLIVIFSAIGGTIGSITTGRMFGIIGGVKAFYCSLIPMTILLILLFPYKKVQDKFTSLEGDEHA
jgi:MFS transporter, FHS family, glucose/mannose:H+ symporter